MEAAKKEDNDEAVKRIISKFGYNPKEPGNAVDNETDIECMSIYAEYESETINNLLEKIAEDGYGQVGKTFRNGEDFTSAENIERYCDLIIMACNAYNDTDYEIPDTDRARLLEFFEKSFLTLSLYGQQGKINGEIIMNTEKIPDEVNTAMEYCSMTFEAETGHKPLEK